MTSNEHKFTVAAIQSAPVFLNKKASTEKACELISEAAKAGATLVVFPEAFIPAYPDWVWLLPIGPKKPLINELYTELLANAVSIPDESTAELCKAAKSAGVTVAIGINECNSESSNASLFNTLLYIGPDGEIIGKHRKLIPTGGERLMWSQGDGSTLETYETEFGRLGGLLCWENFMPLARQAVYGAGTQVYVAPTWDSSPNWINAMKHIAYEGGLFVISVSQALKISDVPDSYEFKSHYPADREWINKGNSCIVNPKGQIIAGPLEAQQGILYAEIDLNLIPPQKWIFDVAGHYARPDVFHFGVNREENAQDRFDLDEEF